MHLALFQMIRFANLTQFIKKINYDCFENLVKISKENNVKKLFGASTVQFMVFRPNVIETNELKPMITINIRHFVSL